VFRRDSTVIDPFTCGDGQCRRTAPGEPDIRDIAFWPNFGNGAQVRRPGRESRETAMVRTVVDAKRAVMRLALVGAVTVGVPVAVADTAEAGSGDHWDRLAKCESSGRWSTNSGNGYYGGLQFSRSTWKAYGGKGMPHRASRSEQVKVAQRVLRAQGWKAWPACSRKLGYR
jgi:hypothetical protein